MSKKNYRISIAIFLALVSFLFLSHMNVQAQDASQRKLSPGIQMPLLSEEPIQSVTISSTLSGDQEVPAPVVTAGTGTATLTINLKTCAITGSVTFSGLTSIATAAHIHQAPAGVNGPVIVPLSGGSGTTSGNWTVPVGSILTTSQLTALKADGLYVNIHTASYPAGEIRAQIDFP